MKRFIVTIRTIILARSLHKHGGITRLRIGILNILTAQAVVQAILTSLMSLQPLVSVVLTMMKM